MNGFMNLQPSFRGEKKRRAVSEQGLPFSCGATPGELSQELRRQTVKGRSRSWVTLKNLMLAQETLHST